MSRCMEKMDNTVVIVGSGVLGSALATVLAEQGRHVTVIERSMKTPNRMKGEILHPGGIDALRKLGLEDCLLKTDGKRFAGYHIADVTNGYSFHMPLPDGITGISFCNGKFVDALRERAMAERRCTYIEGNVSNVIEEDETIKGVVFCRPGSYTKEELRATLTVAADGDYSRLRKINVRAKPSKVGTALSFLYKGSIASTSPSCPDDAKNETSPVSMFYTPDNCIVLNHVSDDVVRCWSQVRGDTLPTDMKAYLREKIAYVTDFPFKTPLFCRVLDIPPYKAFMGEGFSIGAEDMRQQILDGLDEAEIVTTHAHNMPALVTFRPGLITLGDALNIRHPITGAGMTVALKDVLVWRDLLRDIPFLSDTERMRTAHDNFIMMRKDYTFVINIKALITAASVFPANDKAAFHRKCMIDYMMTSPRCTRDMTMMAALQETRQWLLVYHLVASTLYTAGRMVRRGRWWSLPRGLLQGALHICLTFAGLLPILLSEAYY